MNIQKHNFKAKNLGFTLIELLLVVTILAVLAGAVSLAYNGLSESAAHSVDSYNLGEINKAIRNFTLLNEDSYPDQWDSLIATDGTSADLFDRLDEELVNGLFLTADVLATGETDALNEIGIANVYDIDTDTAGANYDNDGDLTNDSIQVAVNRLFDDPVVGGVGAARTLADAGPVALVDTTVGSGGAALLIKLGLDPNADRVVAFGVGNRCTLVVPGKRGRISETPFGRVEADRYGRFMALFQIAGTGGPLKKAIFVGVIDYHGHILDEAFAESQE